MLSLILLATLSTVVDVPTEINRSFIRLGHTKSITFEATSGQMSLLINEGVNVFSCSESEQPRLWDQYESFFRLVATEAPTSPDRYFGNAKTGRRGRTGSNSVGWCDVRASSRNDLLILTFIHNDVCPESTECSKSYASFIVDDDEMVRIADEFERFRMISKE